MKVKYISSACIQVETSDVSILCDPWFTQGIYDGSWFSFPLIDPFDFIDEPDYIYVSHIHPDHYDPGFLHQLFEKFGPKPILIPDFEKNYLFLKGKADGLELTPTRVMHSGNTSFYIEENDMGSISDIDSALIVYDKFLKKSVLNLNDCVFNKPHVKKLQSIINKFSDGLDLVACGYTGAGPYPQTYFDIHNQRETLIEKANNKKQQGFDRYKSFTDLFNARHHLPYAGEYVLGGRNADLNEFRGVSDAFEVTQFDPKAIILKAGGTIDLSSGSVCNKRESCYSHEEISKRIEEISSEKLDYETDFVMDPEKIDFLRLMKKASANAQRKSEIAEEYHFIFSITSDDQVYKRFIFNCSSGDLKEVGADESYSFDEYSEIITDYRLMFGLLTGFYHWNNADVGSAYLTRRHPIDNFNLKVQGFLNFLTVV